MRHLLERLRGEGGYTLTELMVSMAVGPLLLVSTLSAFTSMDANTRKNQAASESQDRTRVVSDELARELRNMASPTPEQPQAVDKAQPYDLVFQTVDPTPPNGGQNLSNVRRVRYCLDAPASGPAKLWLQTQTWTTAAPPEAPATGSCPDAAWGNQRVAAADVTNRTGARPLFVYNHPTLTQISAVTTQIWSQSVDLKKEPTQGLLRSQVFLRNQNEAPSSQFQFSHTGLLHVLLNGSASADPEGEALTYKWYDGPTYVGSGVVLDLKVSNPGLHEITLKTYDSAGLEGTSTHTVNVP